MLGSELCNAGLDEVLLSPRQHPGQLPDQLLLPGRLGVGWELLGLTGLTRGRRGTWGEARRRSWRREAEQGREGVGRLS